MANCASILHSFYSTLIVCILCVSANIDRKLHIVYLGSLPKVDYSPSSHHLSLLQRVIESSPIENLLVRSYGRSFNGFVAMLSDYELQKLANMKEVVSVFPSRTFNLQTTRSWSFMGFDESARRNPSIESNVIVGVIDTGIWPESESFNDNGFGPRPKNWRGSCKGGKNFTCNNKTIGARFYDSPEIRIISARDDVGHGTHTASIAAGNEVSDASYFGIAQGTARGGVPSARIAAYKVCTAEGCSAAEILAAFDDAIADGVDIISISVGFSSALNYYEDPIAIGAFHAIDKGIFISQSAGNNFQKGSVSSVAPWVLTVAASSTDRRIIDKVVLGNGKTLIGNSINSFSLKGENFPLIYGFGALATCKPEYARVCQEGCFNSSLVKGKIVLCDSATGNIEIERVGAVGSILPDIGDVPSVTSSPLLFLNDVNFGAVKSYINSTSQPVANILKSGAINNSSAPVIASFSSRGPNQIVLDLLKPDISAPGVDILAAFPTDIPPTESIHDNRRVKFNIVSGTSMSCPHAAGVAAYVKSFHPEWSPSAIKSAIMTTASPMNATTNTDAEFSYGSGHLNPSKAIDPGLVYDASKEDYIKFLCTISGYTKDMVRRISGDNTTCPKGAKEALTGDLNYPSMTAAVPVNMSFTISFYRTVTNVGLANSTYKAQVFTTKLNIKVFPEVLSFEAINEKKSFNVSVVGAGLISKEMTSASLLWSDENHVVKSPIVVHTYTFE